MSALEIRRRHRADQILNSYGDRLTEPNLFPTHAAVDSLRLTANKWVKMSGSDNECYDEESESDSESESALRGRQWEGC